MIQMKYMLKVRVNSQLELFIKAALRQRKLGKVNPLISRSIKEFVLRDGKRIRPLFFLLTYQLYSKKKTLPASIIRTSLAFELLHGVVP